MSRTDPRMLDLPSDWYLGDTARRRLRVRRGDDVGDLKLMPMEDRLSLATTLKDALMNYSERDIVLELLQDDRVQFVGLPSFLTKTGKSGQQVAADPDIVTSKFSKRDLARILVESNKEIVRKVKLMRRGVHGQVSAKSFPSRVTQPHMYDHEGKLKEQYLTLDHEGLTWTNPYTGKAYVVEVNPVPSVTTGSDGKKVQQYIDTPMWVLSKEASAEIWTPGILYRKDKLGRPLVSELNYEEHHGLVVRGKDRKLHQVHCVKKNAKGGEDPANCKKTKDGRILLKWGAFDKRLRKFAGIAAMKPQFYTPFGVFTYEQLLKMPMDKVLQMLIVLEMLDRKEFTGTAGGSGFEQKFLDQGIVPPGADPKEFAIDPQTGKLARVALRRDKKSRLNQNEKAIQEKYFRSKGLDMCPIKRPHRCYSEAYSMPGLCVNDPKKCQSKKYYEQYDRSNLAGQYGFDTDQIMPGRTYTSERDIAMDQNRIMRNIVKASGTTLADLYPGQRLTVTAATKRRQQEAADRAVAQAQAKLANAQALRARYN